MLQEDLYLAEQKEKALVFARELFIKWEISKQELDDVYFVNFIKN